MAGARWAAMQVALFGGAGRLFAAWSARCVAATRCERFENGVEMPDDIVFAADHLAIATLEPPDAAAGANINIVNAAGGEFLGAANVVDVVGVAAVDHDVAGFELRGEIMQGGIDNASGNHQPYGARLREFFNKIIEGRGAGGAFAAELLYGIGAAVIDDALVAVFLQAAHHVCAHPAEADHAKLHSFAPVVLLPTLMIPSRAPKQTARNFAAPGPSL